MGWDFGRDDTKADVVALCSKNALKKKVVGNHLWTVEEYNGRNIIGLYLLKNDRGFGWGYKALSESVGPCEYDCPLGFLKLAPQPDSPYSANWREKVREYHRVAEAIKKLKAGDIVEFKKPIEFRSGTFTRMILVDPKKRYFQSTTYSNTCYRLTKDQFIRYLKV